MPSATSIHYDAFRDDLEFIRPEPRKHPNQLTKQHCQLQDLLVCPSYGDEFLYVQSNNVFCYNTRTDQNAHAMKDLSFTPTCLAADCGYLAVGGRQGQVMMKQLNGNNWCASRSVGGSTNNNICISRHTAGVRMLVSNNDKTIKVFSLPSFQQVTTISLPTSVNCTAVSPDGTKMIAVGDSNKVFLFDITANGEYRKMATYTASTDAGLSCSWNEYSSKFAVANEDGYINVWDVRYAEKLCKIPAKQQGAVRAVKFSRGSLDLLMFSESVSYVHVIDARTFSELQTLDVAHDSFDQHILGIAFSPNSKNIFVGTEHSVLEYEVDVMNRRCFSSASFM